MCPGAKTTQEAVKYDNRQNRFEIMFGRVKDWQRAATRYDRCPKVFPPAITHVAMVIYGL